MFNVSGIVPLFIQLFNRTFFLPFKITMAISLIVCTLLVFRQVRFMQKTDKGIILSDVLAVRAPRVRDASFGSKLLTFKEEMLKSPLITKFSVTTEVPGRQILWDAGGIFRVGSDQSKNYQIVGIDEADVDQGKISVSSPIARALIGKSVDDLVEVEAPGGVRNYTVVEIRFA